MQYTMVKNFNVSFFQLKFLDLNFVYDMIYFFNRESKSKQFVQMSLAGVDLSKSKDYRDFMRDDIKLKDTSTDMSGMEDIKSMSLKLLKGGSSG